MNKFNENFDTFGVMIDMSRNAVMSMEGLKNFLSILADMGYNCVMLYMEDTYEVDGEPYFGYMRGRYSKEEMKEIDQFANGLGIEIIPCIQTLAHLKAALRWEKIPVDYDDIMLVDDERTYELIDHMFSTLSECFSSRRLHVGMDEAFMLGRGRHLDLHGYETSVDIIKRHLARVNNMAGKYGYQVMVWSDMFFRSWNNGSHYIPQCEVPKEIINSLPKGVLPVYWDYRCRCESEFAGMIENHKQLCDEVWYAGGVWCWEGVVPFNQYSIQGMKNALDACVHHDARNVIMTLWGDNGAECSRFAMLPSLFYISEYAKGNTDEDHIKKMFEKKYGIEFDLFMSLDDPNQVSPVTFDEKPPENPSKYMFYSDCFNGFLDYTVKTGAGEYFSNCAEKFKNIAKKSRRWGYLFDTEAKLCDVLAIKYELGLRTRRAYERHDIETLRALATTDYIEVIKRTKFFAKAFEKQWMAENKSQGFDVQDLRIGGMIRRLESCQERLLEFCNGKIEQIPELEEILLPYGESEKSIFLNSVQFTVSVNVL